MKLNQIYFDNMLEIFYKLKNLYVKIFYLWLNLILTMININKSLNYIILQLKNLFKH